MEAERRQLEIEKEKIALEARKREIEEEEERIKVSQVSPGIQHETVSEP